MSAEPVIVHQDLYDVRGNLILAEGVVVTRKVLSELPKPEDTSTVPLRRTPFYGDLELVLQNTSFSVPLGDQEVAREILGVLAEIEVPHLMVEELEGFKKLSALQYMHAIGSTLLLLRAVKETDGNMKKFSRLARANLVKDLGMTRLTAELLRNTDHLSATEFAIIKRHPIISMILAHYYFGEGLESMIALRHHERGGHGYPKFAADKPSQLVELVSAIDVFYALSSPRSFRRQSFDVRGAIDELADMSKKGEIGPWTIKVLVSMFRVDDMPLAQVELGNERLGFTPENNYYGLEQD